MARIWCFSGSRLSSKGLTRRWFVLPQLYYIIDRWRTPSKGPSPLLRSLLLLFLLSLGYLELLYLIFLLALLYLNLLLSLVLPLLVNYRPFIGRLQILYLPR